MSTILIVGITLDIILLLLVAAFYVASMMESRARDNYDGICKDIGGIMHILEMTKENRAKTEDVEAEVDRTAAKVRSRFRDSDYWQHRHEVLAIWIGAVAFVVIALAVVMDSYVSAQVESAYMRGHTKGLQEMQVIHEQQSKN